MDAVYDRVVVGSDGSPNGLRTVGHAAGVAAASDAQLVVVAAYNPETQGNGADDGRTNGSVRQEFYGEEAARAALRASLRQLQGERVRNIEQRVVKGDPAKALLEVAGDNPKNLIVVGNRGLGAESGEVLGEVPREVVRCAVCDVMVVQTGDEENQTSDGSGLPRDQDGRTML